MGRPGRGARALIAIAIAIALALASAGLVTGRAVAQGSGCAVTPPCVIMVQVDGLEATDLVQPRTPFLWDLAHPGATTLGGQRAAWTWQAPRASMSAGLAANASSYLVGGYPEQTAVTADDFFSKGDRVRLGGSDVDGSDVGKADFEVLGGETVLSLVYNQLGEGAGGDSETAAFIGDPGLGPLIAGNPGESVDAGVDHAWYPTAQDQMDQDPANPQNPALCDIPRAPGVPAQQLPACAAPDETTLARALQDLRNGPDVVLTYVELAELGHVRRSGAGPDEVNAALAKMDAALATFFNAFANDPETQARWGNTIVMLTGTSGYEPTLPAQRVPDPDADTAEPNTEEDGQDLAHDVGQFGERKFELVPQGTVATVYPAPGAFTDEPQAPSEAHRTALADLRQRILSVNEQAQPCVDAGGCIEEVLYTRPELTPTGSSADTVAEAHPGWHLDHLEVDFDPATGDTSATPTGNSGDLLVVMKPGWAAGKAAPTAQEATGAAEDEEIVTNPYPASTGGPRNRAVAAIVNGFTGVSPISVRNMGALENRTGAGDYYPVAKPETPEGTPSAPECNFSAEVAFANNDLAGANADPADDADALGHECQPETLDFAPTAAALLKVSMPPEQICGRLLNEVFQEPLNLRNDDQPVPEAYFKSGPVTAPPGEQFPQSDKEATFEFDSTVQNTSTFRCGGGATSTKTTFECSLDGAEFSACTSPATVGPLSKGVHEFCVQAVNGDVVGDPKCAHFEVVNVFDFDGLLRDLRARVTDRDGKPPARAPRGRLLDRIEISADYGRPLSAVTLTLYRRPKGKKPCGIRVFRPAPPEDEGEAGAPGPSIPPAPYARPASAGCRVIGLARFRPFALDRGHIDLRLRIPKGYSPTNVGLSVQEIVERPISEAEKRACRKARRFYCEYRKLGDPDGGVVRVVNARRLHTIKGGKRKRGAGGG